MDRDGFHSPFLFSLFPTFPANPPARVACRLHVAFLPVTRAPKASKAYSCWITVCNNMTKEGFKNPLASGLGKVRCLLLSNECHMNGTSPRIGKRPRGATD